MNCQLKGADSEVVSIITLRFVSIISRRFENVHHLYCAAKNQQSFNLVCWILCKLFNSAEIRSAKKAQKKAHTRFSIWSGPVSLLRLLNVTVKTVADLICFSSSYFYRANFIRSTSQTHLKQIDIRKLSPNLDWTEWSCVQFWHIFVRVAHIIAYSLELNPRLKNYFEFNINKAYMTLKCTFQRWQNKTYIERALCARVHIFVVTRTLYSQHEHCL